MKKESNEEKWEDRNDYVLVIIFQTLTKIRSQIRKFRGSQFDGIVEVEKKSHCRTERESRWKGQLASFRI